MLGSWAPMQGVRPYFYTQSNTQKAYRWLTFGDNSLSLRVCVSGGLVTSTVLSLLTAVAGSKS
jgi:hypothetical protein